jgi:hypothetical protein
MFADISEIRLRGLFVRMRYIASTFVLLLFIRSLSSAAETKELIAVIDLSSDGTVSPATIDSVCGKIGGTIAGNKRYEVFGREFLPFTLKSVGMPEHPRCSEITCLADIGRKIGTKYIVGGSIRFIKKEWIINLKLVNTESGFLLGTVTKKSDLIKKTFISQKLPSLARELLRFNRTVPADQSTVVANEPVSTEKPLSYESRPDLRAASAKFTEDSLYMNKKPRTDSSSSGAAVSEAKGKSHVPLVIIGAATAVGVAAVVYFKFFNKSPAGENTDLSLDDAPNHRQ